MMTRRFLWIWLGAVCFALFGCDEEEAQRARDLVEIQAAIDYAEQHTVIKLKATTEPYQSRDEWPDWAKRPFVRIKLLSGYVTARNSYGAPLYYADSCKQVASYISYERVGDGTLYLSGDAFEAFSWEPGENQFPCIIENYWHHPKADENGCCRAGVCNDCGRAICVSVKIH